MRFHCLQHVPFETAGILTDQILERGHSLQVTHLYRGDPLPPDSDFDGLIIMGGPMSVHDETEFPWLRPEKELIATAIGKKKKVLGICLGSQLIAEVSGGRVFTNTHKEIGFSPVQWTGTAVQRFPGLREAGSLPIFHWHGETFELPAGALLLASTAACTNQAFLLGEHVLGLQFHPEVTPAIVHDMVHFEGHELVPAPYIQSAEVILEQCSLSDAEWLADALVKPFLYL
jgi:GMP synthase (glutamine-hydrolysing)